MALVVGAAFTRRRRPATSSRTISPAFAWMPGTAQRATGRLSSNGHAVTKTPAAWSGTSKLGDFSWRVEAEELQQRSLPGRSEGAPETNSPSSSNTIATSNNVAQNFVMKYPLGYRCCYLNGSRWTDGSTRSAAISEEWAGAIVIDMSAFNRPAARGWFVTLNTITVNFPDDKTYTGDLSDDLTRITWSNGSVWVKKP